MCLSYSVSTNEQDKQKEEERDKENNSNRCFCRGCFQSYYWSKWTYVVVSRSSDFGTKVGGKVLFKFFREKDPKHRKFVFFAKGTIFEFVFNKKISYTWEIADTLPRTVVTWELEETDNKADRFKLRRGQKEDKGPNTFDAGWSHFLNKLSKYCKKQVYGSPQFLSFFDSGRVVVLTYMERFVSMEHQNLAYFFANLTRLEKITDFLSFSFLDPIVFSI